MRAARAISAGVLALVTSVWVVGGTSVAANVGSSPATAVSGAARLEVAGVDASLARARSSGELPPGWAVTRSTTGRVKLTFTSSADLPVTDAGLEVRAGTTVLGRAQVDGRVASIELDRLPTALSALRLNAGAASAATVAGHLAKARGLGRPLPPGAVGVPSMPAALDAGVAAVPTVSTTYVAGTVKHPDLPIAAELRGRIVAPKVSNPAYPVVVIAHGRHSYCYGGTDNWTWPCPASSKPVPSYLGYEYMQQALASRGFFTVSIDLNAVNAQDGSLRDGGAAARATVIRAHLAKLAAWKAAPGSAPFARVVKADYNLDKVLLVGHSRGGEGVDRAAREATTTDRFKVAGLVHLAPVDFARQTSPMTPSLTLLPGCDGDVYDLQGQTYVDRTLDAGPGAALHTAVYVPGANHNYMNSEWTPGLSAAPSSDDGAYTSCSSAGRLSAAQERGVAASYVLVAARGLIQRHAAATPYLDGRALVTTGKSGLTNAVTPVAGDRRTMWRGNVTGTPKAAPVGGLWCYGIQRTRGCIDVNKVLSPHFLVDDFRVAPALRMSFASAGARAGVSWVSPVNLATKPNLDLRVIVPSRTAMGWKVRVTDAAGKSVTLTPTVGAKLTGLPGPKVVSDAGQRAWAQLVRVRLAGVTGVDLTTVRSVVLVSSVKGSAILLDVSSSGTGLGATAPSTPLPKFEVASAGTTYPEGNTPHNVTVRYTFNAPAPAGVRMSLGLAWGTTTRLQTVSVPVGARTVDVPWQIDGDARDDDDTMELPLQAEATGMVVGGTVESTVTVTDDDPMPTMRASTVKGSVTEGGVLTWRLTLSTVSDRSVTGVLQASPVAAELRREDLLETEWPMWGMGPGGVGRTLSAYPATRWVDIPPGSLTADATMATRTDSLKEGTEKVKLTVNALSATLAPTTLSGSVTNKG